MRNNSQDDRDEEEDFYENEHAVEKGESRDSERTETKRNRKSTQRKQKPK